jgi:hypothetical protein
MSTTLSLLLKQNTVLTRGSDRIYDPPQLPAPVRKGWANDARGDHACPYRVGVALQHSSAPFFTSGTTRSSIAAPEVSSEGRPTLYGTPTLSVGMEAASWPSLGSLDHQPPAGRRPRAILASDTEIRRL